MKNSTLQVAYSCNDAYIPQTGISIISLLENNKNFADINVYLISVNISSDNIDVLFKIVSSYGRKFIIIPFQELCPRLKINSMGRHIETVYAKLFFQNIPEIEKIFYLDSDTVIDGSLEELWNIDLGNNYYGCVKTTTKDYCKVLNLPEQDDFFNDGVALVNVKALRHDNMENLFLKFINKHDGAPPVLSEGTINVVCKGRILALDPTYNFLSAFFMFSNKQVRQLAMQNNFYNDDELDLARRSPVVIHYLAGWYNRPWDQNCTHPLTNRYLYYKSISPWRDLLLTNKPQNRKMIAIKIAFSILPINLIHRLRRIWR